MPAASRECDEWHTMKPEDAYSIEPALTPTPSPSSILQHPWHITSQAVLVVHWERIQVMTWTSTTVASGKPALLAMELL